MTTTVAETTTAAALGTYEVSDLRVAYADREVIGGVSTHISPRMVTAIIGPSGCGKSTFLKTLNRMLELVPGVRIHGQVLLDGEDIYAPGADLNALRRRVGMVFQKPNPFPKSIYENVAFGPRMAGMGKRQGLDDLVQHSLSEAALWKEVKDRLHESAHALSGGQQQRLCIARALAMHPEVLLMDEPCAALDPTSTAKVEETITQLSSHYTIVLVTHNMHQAARTSQRTLFFLNGHLQADDLTEEIFHNPKDPLTSDYIHGRFG